MGGDGSAALTGPAGLKHTNTLVETTVESLAVERETEGVRRDQLILPEREREE